MKSNNYLKARNKLIDMYIKSLEEGNIPWEKMWKTSAPISAISKKRYRGVNNLILSFIAQERGYKDNRWCTYVQMKRNNWNFIKSAKGQGVDVEFFSMYNKIDGKNYSIQEYNEIISQDPDRESEFRLNQKSYKVFNGDLIDGLVNNKEIPTEEIISNDYVENIIDNLDIAYEETGEEAYYIPSDDKVVIPPRKTFESNYSYYATQLHELAHSTGHESRLSRTINNKFGSEEYAKEELRAEISSSFLMQKFGLEYDERHLQNHKGYIKSWLKVLKDNPQELFNAITDSNKIVDYLEENSIQKNKNQVLESDLEMEMV